MYDKSEGEGAAGPELAFLWTESGLHVTDCSISTKNPKLKIGEPNVPIALVLGNIIDFGN